MPSIKALAIFLRNIVLVYLFVGLVFAVSFLAVAVPNILGGASFGMFGNWWGILFAALMSIVFWGQHTHGNIKFSMARIIPDYILLAVFALGIIYCIYKFFQPTRNWFYRPTMFVSSFKSISNGQVVASSQVYESM